MNALVGERYEIMEQIGEGGAAIVYKARDILLDRPVALKVLREQYCLDPAFVGRLRQEARAAAGLSHPHIVEVYDYGKSDDHYYLVMQYVEGQNLKEYLSKRAPLPADQAVEIAQQILAGLQAAHTKGIVHRDMKPQNVLLTPEGVAKVGDFGLAKALSTPAITEAGMTIGSVHYLSPEQALGETATLASDIYAVGIILYEMLTGQLPFDGERAVQIALKHVRETPLSPRRLVPSIPLALEKIVLKAMAKDPQQRWSNASEMQQALEEYLALSRQATVPLSTLPWRRKGTPSKPPAQRRAIPAKRPTGKSIGILPFLLPLLLLSVFVLAGLGVLLVLSRGGLPLAQPTPQATAAQSVGAAPSPTAITPPIVTISPRPTILSPAAGSPSQTEIVLEDTSFNGSFRNPGESTYKGATATWLYGTRTDYSVMSAVFYLRDRPKGQATLTIRGMDSPDREKTRIVVLINDNVVFKGLNPFPDEVPAASEGPWGTHSWEFPNTFLQAGRNILTIKNLENSPNTDAPPWFMLDWAKIEFRETVE
ncbi:MAG: protein kinase [Chloroflexi bacterium]|nr:protein kinase [Chloroflexota bacterium]MCL5075048.1 protein kinase [Chloroflexota bacterium]